MRTISAGMGFGLAIVNNKLAGYGIAVPEFKCDTVAAGAVGVAADTTNGTVKAFTRRPSPQLQAMVAKFHEVVASMELYTISDIAVSDRAVGIIGMGRYGYRLAVVGYTGLPHQSNVADIEVAVGDESFVPTAGSTGWLLAVKSPRHWQATNAVPDLVVTNKWLYSATGWRAPFSHYTPDTELQWLESDSGDCVAAYADYVATVVDGTLYAPSTMVNQYQVRYIPTWHGWAEVVFGHQCGMGRAVDGQVYFWGTQPQ
jgi:hypothetical protein